MSSPSSSDHSDSSLNSLVDEYCNIKASIFRSLKPVLLPKDPEIERVEQFILRNIRSRPLTFDNLDRLLDVFRYRDSFVRAILGNISINIINGNFDAATADRLTQRIATGPYTSPGFLEYLNSEINRLSGFRTAYQQPLQIDLLTMEQNIEAMNNMMLQNGIEENTQGTPPGQIKASWTEKRRQKIAQDAMDASVSSKPSDDDSPQNLVGYAVGFHEYLIPQDQSSQVQQQPQRGIFDRAVTFGAKTNDGRLSDPFVGGFSWSHGHQQRGYEVPNVVFPRSQVPSPTPPPAEERRHTPIYLKRKAWNEREKAARLARRAERERLRAEKEEHEKAEKQEHENIENAVNST